MECIATAKKELLMRYRPVFVDAKSLKNQQTLEKYLTDHKSTSRSSILSARSPDTSRKGELIMFLPGNYLSSTVYNPTHPLPALSDLGIYVHCRPIQSKSEPDERSGDDGPPGVYSDRTMGRASALALAKGIDYFEGNPVQAQLRPRPPKVTFSDFRFAFSSSANRFWKCLGNRSCINLKPSTHSRFHTHFLVSVVQLQVRYTGEETRDGVREEVILEYQCVTEALSTSRPSPRYLSIPLNNNTTPYRSPVAHRNSISKSWIFG
ncbi:hypothetical protein F5879DRAFT_1026785 [Lentinula edodes]|nr:hypothetical protein F5879DRAFT_1026785 [Lentinula edodes]